MSCGRRILAAKVHSRKIKTFRGNSNESSYSVTAPACVTVRENGDAVYFSGTTSRYLEQPTGSPDANVINMAREGLRIPLRTALHKAVKAREREDAIRTFPAMGGFGPLTHERTVGGPWRTLAGRASLAAANYTPVPVVDWTARSADISKGELAGNELFLFRSNASDRRRTSAGDTSTSLTIVLVSPTAPGG